MAHEENATKPVWSEEASRMFIDVGRYYVPEREVQIETICDLIPVGEGPFRVLELACGEGLLAGAILARFPQATVHGLDGSPKMLETARANLAPYGERFMAEQFDLAAPDWRQPAAPVQAVVSSLVIHHLDGPQKQALYADLYRLLAPGGVLVIADVVQPPGERGVALAAKAWDAAVRRRALEFDGDTRALTLFQNDQWNIYWYPDPLDTPSGLFEQLQWLAQAGFDEVDVYWMQAGHAIYGGRKRDDRRQTTDDEQCVMSDQR